MAQARDRAEAARRWSIFLRCRVLPRVDSAAGGGAGGHGEADAAAPDWQPTSERFRDPRTQRIMRVWVDAAGARHYVPESA